MYSNLCSIYGHLLTSTSMSILDKLQQCLSLLLLGLLRKYIFFQYSVCIFINAIKLQICVATWLHCNILKIYFYLISHLNIRFLRSHSQVIMFLWWYTSWKQSLEKSNEREKSKPSAVSENKWEHIVSLLSVLIHCNLLHNSS